jgi:chromate transporter
LKQYRFIRASLAGIQAASVGLTLVAVFTFTKPLFIDVQFLSLGIVAAAFLLADKTKIPAILLFVLALIAGIMGI